MAERALLVLALGDGHGEGMAARGKEVEVEKDRLCGGAGAPSAARIVAGGQTVPKVSAHGVPFAVATAVAAPWGVGIGRLAIDEDGVGFGVELVAAVPAAVTCGDVTQPRMGCPIRQGEVDGEAVGAEEAAIVLSGHLQNVAGVEEGFGEGLFLIKLPFVVARVGFKVNGDNVTAPVIVADPDAYPYFALQPARQFGDFLFEIVFVFPYQSVKFDTVVEVIHTEGGEETYQLNGGLIAYAHVVGVALDSDTLIVHTLTISDDGQGVGVLVHAAEKEVAIGRCHFVGQYEEASCAVVSITVAALVYFDKSLVVGGEFGQMDAFECQGATCKMEHTVEGGIGIDVALDMGVGLAPAELHTVEEAGGDNHALALDVVQLTPRDGLGIGGEVEFGAMITLGFDEVVAALAVAPKAYEQPFESSVVGERRNVARIGLYVELQFVAVDGAGVSGEGAYLGGIEFDVVAAIGRGYFIELFLPIGEDGGERENAVFQLVHKYFLH